MRYFNRVRWIVLLADGKETHTMQHKIISREMMEKKLVKLGAECQQYSVKAAEMALVVEDLRQCWHAAPAAERKLAFETYWRARKELMKIERAYSRRHLQYCDIQLAMQSDGI